MRPSPSLWAGVLSRANKLNAVSFPAPGIFLPASRTRADRPLHQRLLRIRCGPGAAILPSRVTRIHMEFAYLADGGHFGPRRFWRDVLPRLKYWNPAVPMIVNRTANQEGPAVMSIFMSDNPQTLEPPVMTPSTLRGAITGAPEPVEGETVVRIDMKAVRSEAILKEFMDTTGAVPVRPTPEEEQQLLELEDREAASEVDRQVQAKFRAAERQEKRMLEAARQSLSAMGS
jgi:large subunit ribosomal protein MRP49